MSDDTLNPWERQRGESAKAFEAFRHYRDAGAQRTGGQAARDVGKKRPTIDTWMREYRWVERAEAWDREIDRVKCASELNAIREMSVRHANIAVMMQNKIVKRLMAMTEADIKKLTSSETRQWVMDMVKLERLARGEPDTITDNKHEIDAFRIVFVKPDGET